jgi:dihydrofolate reductase
VSLAARNSQNLWIGVPRSSSPAVSLTTLIFATVLAVVKPWGRIRGGRAPKVQRRRVYSGNWGGYWGRQGLEVLDHRLALYDQEQRMVFGASTYRAFAQMLASSTEESEVRDPWVTRMRSLPATVVSTTLQGPLDWPDATVVSGDAVDIVARLKEESEVPLRSHGSLSLNRALMTAGLVDRVQVTLFPVITGQTGVDPIFQGGADFDLELIESRTLDGQTQELIYRPTLHV